MLDTLRCKIAYNKYGGYCVPLSSIHRPAAQKIFAGEVYEPDTIEFMIEHCDNGDIVHAGTYFGDFLPALSAHLAPGALIWAFEPNPESYRCARMTMEINAISNTILTNAGVGAMNSLQHLCVRGPKGRALGGASRADSYDR